METRKNPTISMVSKALAKRIDKQCKQYKAERDTLIDDIAVLRANNKRLESENSHKDDVIRWNSKRIEDLKIENEKFKRISKNLASVNYNYNSLTQHIRNKAEANPNVDRYIALVNYIDRLEKGEN